MATLSLSLSLSLSLISCSAPLCPPQPSPPPHTEAPPAIYMMSRPNTRGKNKRQKTEDKNYPSSQILRQIHLTGEITENDVRQLYMVWKPPCQGCRVNSKESPNCFCGLVPQSSGTRKAGLWQKMPDIISSLGLNPCKDLRSSTDTPAGLTNLGATCYANSILQCLYMNTLFRAGIFAIEPELLKLHPVLDQLARLFAQLHSSKMAFIDSAPFIKTLELDNGVQQDSHEFLTLFLSLLERSLRHSKVPSAKTIVQDLFRGSVSHVTRCSVCGKDSEASSKMEDFYELELNIKGLNNLDESLDDYLSVEELRGENQYFCQSCGIRVDATRNIKLRSLPSVLNFQLKRYVFLPKTTTKKKITSSFGFPKLLDMTKRICNPSESGLFYELSAILIHKGTTVNSGHYVAHIKDENSGQWWEFDDEHVSKLGCHPFGEVPSKSHVESEKDESIVNGNDIDSKQIPSSDTNTCIKEEMFSSTDAYMLMYKCTNAKENGYSTDGNSGMNGIDVDVKSGSLPLHFSEEIEELNTSYASACEKYQRIKDRLISNVTDHRQEVKSVLTEAPVPSLHDTFYWISTEWLRHWADSIAPSFIDNNQIQCSHGKVPVSKVTSMKRISNAAWHKLHSKYGGGPALTSNDYCIDCLKDGAKSAVSADDYRGRKDAVRQLAEAALAGSCPDDISYYVSKPWLTHWLRKKNADSSRVSNSGPTVSNSGPTTSLRCPHGELLPEQAAGAKRVLIPESLWLFLYENFISVKPNDLSNSMIFPSDSRTCEVCSRELSEVACLEDSLREAKVKQRQNHDRLITGKSFSLNPNCKYYLVPSSWLTNWRAYITTTGKNSSSLAEPENLQATIDSLMCKHSRLLERPLELVCKRGAITQKLSNTDGLTLIPGSDWKLFCEEWNVAVETGIYAEVAFANCSTNKFVGSSEEILISEEDLNPPSDEATNELEARKPFIRTYPEICEVCIGERESCELMRKLNYCDEDICVYLVHGKEAPRSIKEGTAMVSESERRTSKRSRKTSFGNSITLKVSGSTSIYQLKMMIWEALGVVKENQKLHKGSEEIESDSATLADKNIFPGDVLWVTDSEKYENRDIADELLEQKIEPRQAEEGFRGTLLTSDL